jgi:hypothetical protein
MDRDIWIVLMEASRIAARRLDGPRRRPVYPDLLVLRMWLWATLHDRPMCWACSRTSYNSLFRPRRLLSVSRFSRRLRTRRFARLRVLLHRVLTDHGHHSAVGYLDGKALPVGECTTDPDARDGAVTTGRFRRGYKLHARADGLGFFVEYRVRPLNEGEALIARKLLRRLDRDTLVLADANYDSRKLYGAIERRGARFLCPVKGRATKARTFRRMPESRRQAVRLWRDKRVMAEAAMGLRATIERLFAHLTGFGGGLGPLPAWARTLRRVRLWVDAKLAIYHARLIARIARARAG